MKNILKGLFAVCILAATSHGAAANVTVRNYQLQILTTSGWIPGGQVTINWSNIEGLGQISGSISYSSGNSSSISGMNSRPGFLWWTEGDDVRTELNKITLDSGGIAWEGKVLYRRDQQKIRLVPNQNGGGHQSGASVAATPRTVVTYTDPDTGTQVPVRETGTGIWVEASPNGNFTFNQTHRDRLLVLLYDPVREMTMKLDFGAGTITYGYANSSGNVLNPIGQYRITSSTYSPNDGIPVPRSGQ